MPMKPRWNEEDDARAIVASIMIGRATPRDLGGGSEQLHDFDVERFDGADLRLR
jgi:hypothetical protein